MVRVIKRYGGGSRKLYDTEESRYVTLHEIAGWIRRGQELRVVDNRTNEDVTAHTLALVISDEAQEASKVSPHALYDVIRRGSAVVLSSVDRFIRLSTDRVGAVRDAREEMAVLRRGLKRLERSVSSLERRRQSRRAPRATHPRPRENPGPDVRS